VLTRAEAPATVVVVDDDHDFVVVVERVLRRAGYRVEVFETGEACIEGLSRVLPDAVCLDLTLPGMSGLETLEHLHTTHPLLPVIMLTATSSVETVVAAMQMGAYDYLQKPMDPTRLQTAIKNAVEHSTLKLRATQLEREAGEKSGYGQIIGQSPVMRQLFRQMDRLAMSDITVLVQGESGTGKELVARALHEHSGRRRKPFVALNCAAIPETLQESELFGHERGAFTGATERRIGKFEQAHGGTLFLDEVAELSPALQAKLLRALQSRTFHRVGGNVEVQSDFRLIAATHTRIAELARAGRFREDLYFRLAVFELDVPPLRDRREDVQTLAETFIAGVAAREGRKPVLSPRALQRLIAYDWPGNVRELENAMHRAVVACNGDQIQPEDLPPAVRHTAVSAAAPVSSLEETDRVEPTRTSDAQPAAGSATWPVTTLNIDALERAAIEEALRQSSGNATEAMKRLGIGRTTLYRKLKHYGLG
jgi:two-component system, NtrC family, response regulator HydG